MVKNFTMKYGCDKIDDFLNLYNNGIFSSDEIELIMNQEAYAVELFGAALGYK